MAITADRVIVELEAKIDRYNANVRAAEKRFNDATRNISRSAGQVERDISRSTGAIGNQLRGLATTFAAAFSVQQIAALADGYTRFTNQLKVAGVEGAALGKTQNDLFGVAQKYGVELESLGTLYSRGSQSAKELGASQADLLQFTTGVAAALKVQGGSAASAQGALLQLSQALGSGTVRAEEFNSINEGALPILKAVAANLTAAGGSVAKLKTLVNDGKVSSDQFFRAFLKGSADLEAQAAKTSLTLSASFTVLNNALGKYIGEADQSLSATERVSAGIIALSKNLDTVLTAVTVLSAVLLGRMVAGMAASAAGTGVFATSLFALQARAAGAATSMEALALVGRTTGARLLAAFGGPVGIAVAALTLGIGYLVAASNDADEAAKDLRARIDAQSEALGTNEKQMLAAAAASNKLTAEQNKVLNGVAALTGEVNLLTTAWARVAAAAKAAAIEQAKATLNAAKGAQIEARLQSKVRKAAFDRAADRPFVERGMGGMILPKNPQQAIAAADRAALADPAQRELEQLAQRNVDAAGAALAKVIGEKLATFKAVEPGKPEKKKKEKKGPKEKDPDEIARRYADELARGQAEYEAAVAENQGQLEARTNAERVRIRTEEAINARAITADKDLDAAQKAKLLLLNAQIADARVENTRIAERQQLDQDALDESTQSIELTRNRLEGELELATTTKQRRDLELRLLDLQYQEERIRLEAIAANTQLRDVEREAARARMAELAGMQRKDEEKVRRDTAGPMEKYRDGINGADINEQLEQVQVDGIKAVEDQLTSTIAKVFELGGAFGQVANQIIQDLIRIGIQKAIVGVLSGSIFGGKSPVDPLAPLPARASGGHVASGKMYRVNEAGIEGFQPAGSGKIIPLGRMKEGGGGGGTTVLQSFTLDARYGITTPELLRHVTQVASAKAAQAGGAAYQAAQRSVPQRLERLNKLGS